mmetsp:Transcript_51295/g.82009  ORF Transcript_51295/g.82009 Transcript_51295/m.82009 type:complete len:302 (-) Transcript_51295:284-1189(-)
MVPRYPVSLLTIFRANLFNSQRRVLNPTGFVDFGLFFFPSFSSSFIVLPFQDLAFFFCFLQLLSDLPLKLVHVIDARGHRSTEHVHPLMERRSWDSTAVELVEGQEIQDATNNSPSQWLPESRVQSVGYATEVGREALGRRENQGAFLHNAIPLFDLLLTFNSALQNLGFVHAQNMAVVFKQGVAPQVCPLQLPHIASFLLLLNQLLLQLFVEVLLKTLIQLLQELHPSWRHQRASFHQNHRTGQVDGTKTLAFHERQRAEPHTLTFLKVLEEDVFQVHSGIIGQRFHYLPARSHQKTVTF